MHSLPGSGRNALVPTLTFMKAARTKDFEWNHYFADLQALRQIADETHAFAQYGLAIFNFVVGKHRRDLEGPQLPPTATLPVKPETPKRLAPEPGTVVPRV